jgi:hypothetical protein
MPVLIIFYVSSCFLLLLNSFVRSEILLTAPCFTCLLHWQHNCTVNLIVLLSFHVVCTGPAFLCFHTCISYITAETVVGHYIRTEMYLYVSPKYPHCNVWCIHYHNVCLSYCWYQWRCGLRRRSVGAHCWDREVRIPLSAWMFISCVCFLLCR